MNEGKSQQANFALLGVCGLYCGACYHYRAASPEGKHLLALAVQQGRSEDDFTCGGCRSDKLYIHPGCSECAFRACTDEKGLLHCGLCVDYPCGRLKAFQADGRPHHADIFDNIEDLIASGHERWLAKQERRWTCRCGAKFSWYEERCHACEGPLNSYGPNPGRPA
jgi:hypothetical protein